MNDGRGTRQLRIILQRKTRVLAHEFDLADYHATGTAVTALGGYLVLSGALTEEWRAEWTPPRVKPAGLLNTLRAGYQGGRAQPLDLYLALKWLERMGIVERQIARGMDTQGDCWRLTPNGKVRYLRGIISIYEQALGPIEAALSFDEADLRTPAGYASELKRALHELELKQRERDFPPLPGITTKEGIR